MARVRMHPGELLKLEFMEPYELSANQLARMIDVPGNRISEIVAGRRNMTADTALRLERLFGMPASFWLHAQAAHDESRERAARDYSTIEPYAA